ncbi:hypothetical protein SDC9_198750 [bioreactor metagenome]|uniref:Uncharacterized protein n=1 Tax=bioreactor metagenome TaxID=1076179 RepID=A0A645III4_9ZZZZ
MDRLGACASLQQPHALAHQEIKGLLLAVFVILDGLRIVFQDLQHRGLQHAAVFGHEKPVFRRVFLRIGAVFE